MNLHRPLFISALLLLCPFGEAISRDLTDDFSHDSGQWRSQSGGVGKHAVESGRLEFSTPGNFSNNDSVTHVWKLPIARYDESWEVRADVFLGDFRLGKDPYAGLAIKLGVTSNPAGSFVRMQFRRGDQSTRAFNADAFANRKSLGSKWMKTTGESATLRLQFDASVKVITASYDSDARDAVESFATLYTLDISKAPGNWRMSANDTFEFSMVSQSTSASIASGNMYFDNVIVRNLAR